MPEENRVFDISKPGSTSSHPTSKPVIVGHQPTMSDPMVNNQTSGVAVPTPIMVQDAHSDDPQAPHADDRRDDMSAAAFAPFMEAGHSDAPQPTADNFAVNPVPSQDPMPTSAGEQHDYSGGNMTGPPAGPSNDDPIPTNPTAEPQPPIEPIGRVEGIHLPPKKRGPKMFKWLFILLLLAVAGYLFIDSNIVNTGINLPYHVFKQKKVVVTSTATPPPSPQAQTSATTVPVGFSRYKVTGTTVTFASPTAWGKPVSTIDPGYTARGGDNKPDSKNAYAYILQFPNNKDVEMAITSSKYLPPVRDTLYYDFLQWCTGSGDGKYYFSVLRFTTTDKIDSPSTATCDQGPLVNPTKVDGTTIVQLAAKNPNGDTLGDLYTKNLTNTDYPVLRIKDVKMTNSADVKKVLLSISD